MVVAQLVSFNGEPMEVKNDPDERYNEIVLQLAQIEQRLTDLESPSAKFIPLSESIAVPGSSANENHE